MTGNFDADNFETEPFEPDGFEADSFEMDISETGTSALKKSAAEKSATEKSATEKSATEKSAAAKVSYRAHQVYKTAYETLLTDCCHYEGILSVLNQHRPYFEALPSIRRLQESMVIIPLPNVRSREVSEIGGKIDARYRIRPLPCDLALMVCDPEWQIKTGIEIVLFIQRPHEDFSELIGRWRQTQVELGQGVEWLMPRQYKHLLAEGNAEPHPLFVVFTADDELSFRSERMIRGLVGSRLPVATQPLLNVS